VSRDGNIARTDWSFGFALTIVTRKYLFPEYIGIKKRTQGTETSKYLEERTSTETPLVVASERGPGQCSF
jgi:hypothetical protein